MNVEKAKAIPRYNQSPSQLKQQTDYKNGKEPAA